jgi:hypothetical protein
VSYYNKEVLKEILQVAKSPAECLPHALPRTMTVGRRALRISDLNLPFRGLLVAVGIGSLILIFEIFFAKFK